MTSRGGPVSSHSRIGWRPPWWLLAAELALLALVAALMLGAGEPPPPYARGAWGGWAVEGCRDTRTRVLLRDAEPGSVLWREGRQCEPAHGRWVDAWTGQVLRDPSGLDVDHHVPLAEAHRSGGGHWPDARRRAYANDLAYRGHLRVLGASTNRSKGDRGPQHWRPPKRQTWCAYAEQWAAVKFVWDLRSTEPERLAVREMLKTCGDPDARTLLDPAPTPAP